MSKILIYSYFPERYEEERAALKAQGHHAVIRKLVEHPDGGCACNDKLEPCHYVITDEPCIVEAYKEGFPNLEVRFDDSEPVEVQDDIEDLPKKKKKK